MTEIAIVISVGLLYYYIGIKIVGISIPCFFNKVTGLTCPGCGITFMLVKLLSFEFAEAFHSNPALFCTLPFIAVVLVADKIDYIREGMRKKRLWKNVIIISATAILIVFCIYRNIVEGIDHRSLFGLILKLIQK